MKVLSITFKDEREENGLAARCMTMMVAVQEGIHSHDRGIVISIQPAICDLDCLTHYKKRECYHIRINLFVIDIHTHTPFTKVQSSPIPPSCPPNSMP